MEPQSFYDTSTIMKLTAWWLWYNNLTAKMFTCLQNTPEQMKARQKVKMMAWEAEMKKQCRVLKPVYIGCIWWSPDGSEDPNYDRLKQFEVL